MCRCAPLPPTRETVKEMLNRICDAMRSRVPGHFSELAVRKSDFFRDLAAADYMQFAEQFSESKHASFDVLCGLFDAAILEVENAAIGAAFERHSGQHWSRTLLTAPGKIRHGKQDCASPLSRRDRSSSRCWNSRNRLWPAAASVPERTDPQRDSLPWPGRPRHVSRTRTVLDIGGQDTKAIQVDADRHRHEFSDE